MRRIFISAIIIFFIFIIVSFFPSHSQSEEVPKQRLDVVYTPKNFKCASQEFSIRVLILKHCRESMAHYDANLAVRAVNKGKEAGLDIKMIGNHNVDNLNELEDVFREKIKNQAKQGDTLIVHTIGHGGYEGGLQFLGQRQKVMEVFVKVAEANKQETIWWQLSCHASSRLPKVNSQQKLFSNLASSQASRESPSGEQGPIMEKLFVGIANKEVDTDKNGVITAGELSIYLNRISNRLRLGDRVFARSSKEPIFGTLFGAINIPIYDWNKHQLKKGENFILLPS